MSSLPEVKIPYSAIAVANLVKVELEHKRKTYSNGKSLCRGDLNDPAAKLTYDPCPTLKKARGEAARETLVAVALILGGEKND